MNASKIVVPSAVAEAIRHYTDLADSKSQAFTDILSLGYEATQSEIILRHFDHDYDELMEALICGYEVEKSPEDKVREYYGELYVIASNSDPGDRQYRAECQSEAVQNTLDLLGITIAGINDDGGDGQ
jgi:hypothetical protein